MSVTTINRYVDVFRAYGVRVTFEPGWEDRGNGQSSAYEGAIVHHTATGFSNTRPQILVSGRSDLAGPLCNFAGLTDGGIHVIAANPANHAGASGGRSMGPLPTTASFNRRVLGLEIVYPGTEPMTDAQYRTALVFAIATRQVFGRPSMEWTRAHAETSVTGKWDPGWAPGKTIDMNVFRRDAAALEASGGDDMPSAEEIATAVWSHILAQPDQPENKQAAWVWLTYANVAAWKAADGAWWQGTELSGADPKVAVKRIDLLRFSDMYGYNNARALTALTTAVSRISGVDAATLERELAEAAQQIATATAAAAKTAVVEGLASRPSDFSDEDLDAIGRAVQDEEDRRARERLES